MGFSTSPVEFRDDLAKSSTCFLRYESEPTAISRHPPGEFAGDLHEVDGPAEVQVTPGHAAWKNPAPENTSYANNSGTAGADANAKDGRGRTSLDYAQGRARLKDTEAYRQLQEASQ